jgi:hypothetical protein
LENEADQCQDQSALDVCAGRSHTGMTDGRSILTENNRTDNDTRGNQNEAYQKDVIIPEDQRNSKDVNCNEVCADRREEIAASGLYPRLRAQGKTGE